MLGKCLMGRRAVGGEARDGQGDEQDGDRNRVADRPGGDTELHELAPALAAAQLRPATCTLSPSRTKAPPFPSATRAPTGGPCQQLHIALRPLAGLDRGTRRTRSWASITITEAPLASKCMALSGTTWDGVGRPSQNTPLGETAGPQVLAHRQGDANVAQAGLLVDPRADEPHGSGLPWRPDGRSTSTGSPTRMLLRSAWETSASNSTRPSRGDAEQGGRERRRCRQGGRHAPAPGRRRARG